MSGLAHAAPVATPLQSSRALVARFTPASVELSVDASPESWVEYVTSSLTPTDACAVIEHLFGVLPLIDTFFTQRADALAAVTSGAALTTLGLFTPTPDHRWGAAALSGDRVDGAWRVHGEIRVPSAGADGSIVLVQSHDAECQLAWLDHQAPGVKQSESRSDEPRRRNAPCWLTVEDVTIPSKFASRPVTLTERSELHHCLDRYASIWALVAIDCARRAIRALRHAVRTTRFGVSQLVAMDITDVEIETELTISAAQQHVALAESDRTSTVRLALALSAARILTAVAARALDLRDQLGVVADTPLAEDGVGAALTAYLGGTLMLEHELARAVGVGRMSAP